MKTEIPRLKTGRKKLSAALNSKSATMIGGCGMQPHTSSCKIQRM